MNDEIRNNNLNQVRKALQFFLEKKSHGHGHATMSFDRSFLPILQEEFPELTLVPAFPFLEEGQPSMEEYWESKANLDSQDTELENLLKLLEEELPELNIMQLFHFLKEELSSIEKNCESHNSKNMSDEVRSFLRNGQKMLTEFSESMCSNDEILVSIYF